MKLKSLFMLALLTVSANAAVTLSGTGLTGAKKSDGATNVATGTLALLIVDTAGDGFFNLGTALAANTALTSTNDPGILTTSANLGIGGTFGGEKILNVLSSPGGGTFSSFLNNVSIAGFESKNFAIVWFDAVLASDAPAQAAAGSKWGLIRGSDWTLPAADSGSFAMNGTDSGGAATYFAPSALSGGATSTAFRTTNGSNLGNTAFTIVPEPSAALLGAIGALGLLRRRRI